MQFECDKAVNAADDVSPIEGQKGKCHYKQKEKHYAVNTSAIDKENGVCKKLRVTSQRVQTAPVRMKKE